MPTAILLQSQPRAGAPLGIPSTPTTLEPLSLDERLHEVESRLITWALTASHGNKSRAAELLHIKRSTLGDRIRKLGLAAHTEPVHESLDA